MEPVCARRALDATPVENRIKHFPSQMILVMWTRIVIGSTKHEIIRTDIFGAFKMLHQDTLERSRHMPDVLLAGLRRILKPASFGRAVHAHAFLWRTENDRVTVRPRFHSFVF